MQRCLGSFLPLVLVACASPDADPAAEPPGDVPSKRFVVDCKIQEEIDRSSRDGDGGLVVIPEGKCTIYTPIILPRTSLSGRHGVQLEGEGSHITYLVAGEGFPEERGMIEWAPATGAGNADERRTWSQRIAGLTLTLPPTHAHGIWYKRTLSEEAIYEKAQFDIEDVVIETFMNWRHTAIQLEGNVHDSVIRQVEIDVGASHVHPGRFAHDSRGIVFDDGDDDGIDDNGVYNLVVDGLSITPRSGGFLGEAISGRVMFGTLRNIKIGRGSRGAPQIRLVGSFSTTVSLITEGASESAQVLVSDSRGIVIEDSLLGTPTPVTAGGTTYPTGDGVVFLDCDGCAVRNWAAHDGKLLWDKDFGAARVRLDAASNGCDVDIMIGGNRWGLEDPFAVVVDEGTRNRVRTHSAYTGEIVERYDRVRE